MQYLQCLGEATLLSALLLAFTNSASANSFGPAYSTGPVSPSSNFITSAVSTLIVPNAPNPIVGNTVLWTGIGTSTNDLVQGINNNYPADNSGSACGNLGNHWCVAAYDLGIGRGGPITTSSPGDQVKMQYIYNVNTKVYDQTVFINGKAVSAISNSTGVGQGFGTAVECTTNPCGTVPAHSWMNTKIVLNVADPNYGSTAALSTGVTGTISTPDHGKTWNIPQINIPQSYFSTD